MVLDNMTTSEALRSRCHVHDAITIGHVETYFGILVYGMLLFWICSYFAIFPTNCLVLVLGQAPVLLLGPWQAPTVVLAGRLLLEAYPQQGLLATYLIRGCVGRGVRLGCETLSGAGGGVWTSGNLELWRSGDLKIRESGNFEIWGPEHLGI